MIKKTEQPVKTQYDAEVSRVNEDNSRLVVKWQKLLLAENAPRLQKEELGTMARLIENQHNWVQSQYEEMGKSLQESYVSTTGGVEPFLKILVPTIRRAYKSMSALDLVGVQPMNAPQGFAYALRFHYAGDKEKGWLQPASLDRANNPTNVANDNDTYGPKHMSYVLVFPKNHTTGATYNAVYADIDLGTMLAHKTISSTPINASAKLSAQPTYIAGEVVYKEETRDFVKVMINRYSWLNVTTQYSSIPVVTNAMYFTDCLYTDLGSTAEGSTDVIVSSLTKDECVVNQYFHNEIGFRFVLKNFTGRYTTAEGEQMGVYGAPEGTPEWKTIKMTMERVPVYVQTRKLKLQYSDEMYQDLKAVHGMLVNEELMRIAEFEVANEINADILERMITVSTDAGSWAYGTYVGIALASDGNAHNTGVAVAAMADGRFEKEKFQTLATKIRKEANEIALYTRRGSGNFVIVSPNVLTCLQALDFIPAAATGGETLISGLSFVGMLQNLKVYVDTYNIFGQDYALVGYKGASQYDAGLIYCPYIALQVKKAVDPSSMQDVYGFLCRDSIINNLYGAEYYYRTITIDLSGSSIGGLS